MIGAIGPVVTGSPPPTPISRTTRSGSRRHVRWLNQPAYCGKGEPNRRKAGVGLCPPRIGEPDAKSAVTNRAVLDASLLLVILHYLLKNNTSFMGGIGQGKLSPRFPSVTYFLRGGN